jgi:hypothetical protein
MGDGMTRWGRVSDEIRDRDEHNVTVEKTLACSDYVKNPYDHEKLHCDCRVRFSFLKMRGVRLHTVVSRASPVVATLTGLVSEKLRGDERSIRAELFLGTRHERRLTETRKTAKHLTAENSDNYK